MAEGKGDAACAAEHVARSSTTLVGNGNENKSWYVLWSDSVEDGVNAGY